MLEGYRPGMKYRIASPVVGKPEERAVAAAVRANDIARGPSIGAFESAFAKMMGSGEAVSVVTGTAAVEVAVRALRLEGAEVVTGAMSCQATVNALLAAGCRIRFADHDPDTWQVSVPSLAAAMTPRTRGIVVAHLYGQAADCSALAKLARVRKALLVEDCAQSLGATWNGKPVGAFGAAAAFSFYGNKLITTGEGGMVWTTRKPVAARARLVRDYGQDYPFHNIVFGLNWKMPNLLAALGVEQLKRVPALVKARRDRAALLRRELSGHALIRLPVEAAACEPAPFCFPIVVEGVRNEIVRKRLAEDGIETRPLFPPQFDQPAWTEPIRPAGRYPVARRLARDGLYLSASPHLSLTEIRWIAGRVRRAARR
jgi:perosamine synthetase